MPRWSLHNGGWEPGEPIGSCFHQNDFHGIDDIYEYISHMLGFITEVLVAYGVRSRGTMFTIECVITIMAAAMPCFADEFHSP